MDSPINFNEIPGYREAVEHENLVRNAAFLPILESIGGFEALPLTLERYVLLRTMDTPLLGFGDTSPQQLAGFLWAVSPQYSPRAGWARSRFLSRCRRKLIPGAGTIFKQLPAKIIANMMQATTILMEARRYIGEAFQDSPSTSGPYGQKSYYCDAAYLCHLFAEWYGWADDITLRTPLKRLFQYQKIHRERDAAEAGRRAILFNPSDRIIAKWQEKQAQN